MTAVRQELVVCDWRLLPPSERWAWWERLWADVVLLCERYKLELRRAWWRQAETVERLEAFCRWLWMHDSGRLAELPHSAPPGKLALLDYLERLRADLAGGDGLFDPDHEWPAYARHVHGLGGEPPDPRRLQQAPRVERPQEAA